MTQETPTTEQVREHYGESCSWHHPGRDQREIEWDAAKERFDSWLTEVKAEAWDQGYMARGNHDHHTNMSLEKRGQMWSNPYRKEGPS